MVAGLVTTYTWAYAEVTSNAEITIDVAVRDHLGVQPGDAGVRLGSVMTYDSSPDTHGSDQGRACASSASDQSVAEVPKSTIVLVGGSDIPSTAAPWLGVFEQFGWSVTVLVPECNTDLSVTVTFADYVHVLAATASRDPTVVCAGATAASFVPGDHSVAADMGHCEIAVGAAGREVRIDGTAWVGDEAAAVHEAFLPTTVTVRHTRGLAGPPLAVVARLTNFRVAEPVLTLDVEATPGPLDVNDTVSYTVTLEHVGAVQRRSAAYDVTLTAVVVPRVDV